LRADVCAVSARDRSVTAVIGLSGKSIVAGRGRPASILAAPSGLQRRPQMRCTEV